jgi:hypothetical protein
MAPANPRVVAAAGRLIDKFRQTGIVKRMFNLTATARPEHDVLLIHSPFCSNINFALRATGRTQRSLPQNIRIVSTESSMISPRRFERVRPRGQVSASAKLLVGPRAPVIDCHVVDYSGGGACLELSPKVSLPPRFEMLHGGTRKRCRLVWRAGYRLGVAF